MSSVKFANRCEIHEIDRIPTRCFRSLYYSKAELDQFRNEERTRCQKIMSKDVLSAFSLTSSERLKTASAIAKTLGGDSVVSGKPNKRRSPNNRRQDRRSTLLRILSDVDSILDNNQRFGEF